MVANNQQRTALSHKDYREHRRQINLVLESAKRFLDLGHKESAEKMIIEALNWHEWLMTQDFDFSDLYGGVRR